MTVTLKRLFFTGIFFICASAKLVDAKDCIGEVLERLHVDQNMTSDPQIMRNVVFNEFYLDQFPEAIALVKDYLDKPQPLSDFLGEIHSAIETKHPAIQKFLCVAVEKNIIPQIEEKNTALIKRTIHNMLVLETMLKEMIRDVHFMEKTKEHYIKKRNELLPKDSSLIRIYHATGGLFEEAKFLTMDKVFDQYHDFRQKDHLDKEDLFKKNIGLRLNVMEATLADEAHLNLDNAYAGRTLLYNQIEKIELTDEGLIKQYFTKGWSSLYETWNLAFVLGNLDDLNIILPKLLIPSVIGAHEEDYLYNRGLSLWVTINLNLLHNLHKKESAALPESIKKPLTQEWGRINKEYAKTVGKAPKRLVLPEIVHTAVDSIFNKFHKLTGSKK